MVSDPYNLDKPKDILSICKAKGTKTKINTENS